MGADEHGTAAYSDRPITLEAAQKIGAFTLAEQWADRMSWPWPGRETARAQLAEMAHMSALAMWLRRWQPIHIHGALMAGARPEEVAAAFGDSLAETYRHWHGWASGQRTLSKPAVLEQDFAVIVRVFAALGFSEPEAP